MFFLEGLSEVPEPPPEAETVSVYLSFDGDPPGCFQMRLAARLPTPSPPISSGRTRVGHRSAGAEVGCELANMICGSVLSRIESNAAFRLGTPQIAADKSRPATSQRRKPVSRSKPAAAR